MQGLLNLLAQDLRALQVAQHAEADEGLHAEHAPKGRRWPDAGECALRRREQIAKNGVIGEGVHEVGESVFIKHDRIYH